MALPGVVAPPAGVGGAPLAARSTPAAPHADAVSLASGEAVRPETLRRSVTADALALVLEAGHRAPTRRRHARPTERASANVGDRRVAPPTDLGERFLAELYRDPPERPQPLPPRFEPLAASIAGRPVRIATGIASRRALRAVGKRAATTDDVIHLDRPPGSGRADAEVLAHELTHAAHPSPEPRFFADPRPSREERRAEEIGRIMASAPAPVRAVRAGDTATSEPVHPAASPVRPVIRRQATAPRPPTATGTVSAESLAAAVTAAPRGSIQRFTTADAASTSPAAAGTAATANTPVAGAPAPAAAAASRATTSELLDQFDRIVELLEERIIVELERRGGRYRGGF